MDLDKIRQLLNDEKPTADLLFADKEKLAYYSMLSSGEMVFFNIPLSQIGEERFHKTEKAIGLLKWISKQM